MKSLIESQAAYLLVAMRRKIMGLPLTYVRRIINLTDVNQAHRILKDLSISLLNELRDLPQKVVDRNWLRELDDGR